MDGLYCTRCKHTVSTATLTAVQKQQALIIHREQGAIHAMAHLYRACGLSLGEAKLLDLQPQPNHCHRCAYQQLAPGEVICPKCKSVNLNW